MIRRLTWLLGAERRNRGWKPWFRELQRVVAMTPEAFGAWQAEQVRAHLAWARAAVPYFGDLPPDADTLEAFPILTRADVQSHVEALCDGRRPESELIRNASGGSTGEPVVVYQDREYGLREFATENWIWFWWGLTPWCTKAYLWGDDLNPEDHTWKARLEARLLGEVSLNVFDLDAERIEAFVRVLEAKQPDVILGYASALELFAEHLARRGGLGYRPKLLRSAAEAVDDDRRARIEAGFGQRLTDYYGSRESASLAAQWLDGHYYVFAHGRVLEIVDEAGRPVPPGVPGRVLVTDFTNRAFGLIRYENGDVASWAEPPAEGEPRPCPFPRLARIHGRTSDFITTPGGAAIHGEFFTHLFYGVREVTRFQVRQDVVDRLTVLTVGSIDGAAMAPLLEKIRAQVGPDVQVDWRAVDEIPLTKTGKHRYTVSAVPFGSGVA